MPKSPFDSGQIVPGPKIAEGTSPRDAPSPRDLDDCPVDDFMSTFVDRNGTAYRFLDGAWHRMGVIAGAWPTFSTWAFGYAIGFGTGALAIILWNHAFK